MWSKHRRKVPICSIGKGGKTREGNRAIPFRLGSQTFSLKHQTAASVLIQQSSRGIAQIAGTVPNPMDDKS
jgi:predicted component of type VI protein secretion system